MRYFMFEIKSDYLVIAIKTHYWISKYPKEIMNLDQYSDFIHKEIEETKKKLAILKGE